MSLFTIDDELIDTYQDGIDSLIESLGQDILLCLPPTSVFCDNCIYDSIRGRSSGRYKAGGPIAFTDGTMCPKCKGVGKLNYPVNVTVKALIKWNPQEFFTEAQNSVQFNNMYVRTKTYIVNRVNLEKCDHSIIEGYNCKIVRSSVPVGLKERRYIVNYWEVLSK